MKKIIILIKPYKLSKILEDLQSNGFEGIYFEEVKSFNLNDDNIKSFFPRIEVSVFLFAKDIDKFKEIIISATDDIRGNSNIFKVSNIVESIDIETGKRECFSS
jgi:nitrogen regulatory protein PII